MCIYLFFDLFLFVMVLLYNNRNSKQLFVVSTIILITLLGLHDGTGDPKGYGYDYPDYLNFFKGAPSVYGSVDSPHTYELEWPYYYFCKILRLFGKWDFLYIISLCLVVQIPFIIMVKKYSKNVVLSILWLFLIQKTLIHLFVMTAHRQMIAHAFFMTAMLLYLSLDKSLVWKKNIKTYGAIIGCLIVAVLGHSSSYFVLPVLIALILLPQISKRNQIIVVSTSFIVGVFLYELFLNQFTQLMFLLGDIEEIQRSTHYLVDDVYDTNKASLYALLPQTIMTLSVVYFSNKDELNTIFTKCLVWATVLVNIFFSVPLISRSLTTLWIIAIAGCIPIAFRNNREARLVMTIVIIMQIFIAYRQYIQPSFRMLPFHFIWE